MYNNNPQYPPSEFLYAQPPYPQEYSGNYNYQGYTGYGNQAIQSQPAQPQSGTSGNFAVTNWMSQEPNQNDAVVQEMQQQKAQLVRQREDYVRKATVLKHELEQLQGQKQDLMGSKPMADSDLSRILQQNSKLQEEIQGKMKAIHNVIEMLSGIIKDGQSISDLEASLSKNETQSISKSPTSTNWKTSSTPDHSKKNVSENYNYVHYDTGLHWCRMCDEFPETAKDFLLHLQDKKHRETMKYNDIDSTPWHKLPPEQLMPTTENAPTKRIPIKGLQFFIPAPSWYCKLCDVWIGDLHCASQHLKSKTHYQNYENFIGQNPGWETEWVKDREKAMSRKGTQASSDSEEDKKKRRRRDKHLSDAFLLKDKKKKKKSKRKKKQSSDSSSSSSSSDSSSDDNEDKSRSIRVAMRNMKKVQSIMDEDLSAKWSVLEKLVEEHKKKEVRDKEDTLKANNEAETSNDPLINQWMSVPQPPAKEKLMLDTLRNRMRHKLDIERTRMAEIDKKKREKEREEQDHVERKRREEKYRVEEADRLKKQREMEEIQKLKDRERNQIKFKTNSHGRSKRSHSESDNEDNDEDKIGKYNRRNSEREGSYKNRNSRSRSKSHDHDRRIYNQDKRSPDQTREENDSESSKKKIPGPPSYKKLPFIGRMPLFKNKTKQSQQEEKDQPKEIKKQAYEPARRTRFEPGNLPKAFIPKPDVVCFPKLSSIPPLTIPPPPPTITTRVSIPEPPKISDFSEKLQAPPPPKLDCNQAMEENNHNLSDDEVLYGSEGVNPSMMGQYYQQFEATAYQSMNSYSYEMPASEMAPPPPEPHSHSMPLQPPPLPPDDDLALLGICADDMAAQSF
ncbi:zinc finger matrin-type protein CG9776 isoform X1 [Diorhabda sublineata]|uniref:zinc finger matrin-type protein CG9776 isoform X1 n=2 Tax=Diorhabda sublineata TaxID=1163346 RepID=UPI0024E09071|nr:zinc finger matrin-type protein CG9776 isoform X1 [Diorhabda sublineata]